MRIGYVPTAQLRQAQQKLAAQKISSVIVPAYYWGVNNVTGAFPGSIHIRPEIMTELMTDVFRSLARAGFKEIFCITGHYDAAHGRALIEGVRRANQAGIIKAHFVVPKPLGIRLGLQPGETGFLLIEPSGGPAPTHPDLHAGEGETSAILAVAPDLVHKDIAAKLPSTDLTMKDVEEWRKGQERAKRSPARLSRCARSSRRSYRSCADRAGRKSHRRSDCLIAKAVNVLVISKC